MIIPFKNSPEFIERVNREWNETVGSGASKMYEENWKDLDSAPMNEPVLVVLADCSIRTAVKEKTVQHDEKNRPREVSVWFAWPREIEHAYAGFKIIIPLPKLWMPLPNPPKHLWERKLAADVLTIAEALK